MQRQCPINMNILPPTFDLMMITNKALELGV
jgi:hypothetical protein